MKTAAWIVLIAFSLSSCIIESVEPRYDNRDRFVGFYQVEEYSSTFRQFANFPMEVRRSGSRDEIRMINFYDSEISIYARVSGSSINIPFQIVDGYEIEGSGYLSGGELLLDYRVRDRYSNVPVDYCESRAWRH